MPELQETGEEEKQPFFQWLDLRRSYLPILASITLFQGSIAMPDSLEKKF
jgi:hypothetical protein